MKQARYKHVAVLKLITRRRRARGCGYRRGEQLHHQYPVIGAMRARQPTYVLDQ